MATLPNNSGGNSNARKILTTDPVHADIVNMTVEDLDQNIDAVNAESAATKSEVETARSGEASLDARIDSVSSVASTVSSEVSTARSGETNLSNRLALIASLQPSEYQEIQAELARQVVPSGWLTEILTPKGEGLWYYPGEIFYYTGDPTTLFVASEDQVIVNGYKLKLANNYPVNTSASVYPPVITPPATGSRVDLCFLEVCLKDITNPASSSTADRRLAGLLDDGTLAPYGNMDYGSRNRTGGTAFDSTDASHRFQVQYRFRTVSGVDILTYPEGVNHGAVVKAWPSHKRDSADGIAESSYTFTKSSTDAGLYVAGDGSGTAKTALGTSDGYVYAIPICAVHRRNTGDYNVVTNPNGAGATNLTVSQRPDGLFSHKFDVRDIIDLRHQVSFSGFDYQKLLAEGISDLLTGQLKTMFVPGDGIGIPSDVFGTTHMYVEQFGGADVNNVNNRTTGNNSAITSMSTNGQRRCWNDAAQTETNHAKVTQTTTDLAPLNADYGVIRSAGTGTWDHSDVLTITAPVWTTVATGDIDIFDELGNDVTATFTIAGSGNTATCTLSANFSSTFTADDGTEQLTISSNSSWKTGARVQVSTTTTLPAGLAAATDYYIIYVDATTVKLATSRANAIAGTAIDITDAGTGTHTLTQQAPSFEAETNLHVVYNVAYPAGGGLVNVPGKVLRVEDGAGLLLDSCNGESFSTNSYNFLDIWFEHSTALIGYRYSAIASVANEVTVSLPSGYNCVGMGSLNNDSTGGNDLGFNITEWSQAGASVTIKVSSGISINDGIRVTLYSDRPWANFQRGTKGVIGTEMSKEITINTDASGNGVTYFDHGETGLSLLDYSSVTNTRNVANNQMATATSRGLYAHKVTITGCSVVSGSVKVLVKLGKALKNNESLRVWYECVPYMGIGQQHALTGGLIDPGAAPEIIAAYDKILVSTIGTAGIPAGFSSTHLWNNISSRLPIGNSNRDYNFSSGIIIDKLGSSVTTGSANCVMWVDIVTAIEDNYNADWGWYPGTKTLNLIQPNAYRGYERIDGITAGGLDLTSGVVHYNVVFALLRAVTGKIYFAVCRYTNPGTSDTAEVWGWSNNTGADFVFIQGRPLIK